METTYWNVKKEEIPIILSTESPVFFHEFILLLNIVIIQLHCEQNTNDSEYLEKKSSFVRVFHRRD